MAEAYPLVLCNDVSLDSPKVTIVGNVVGTHERGVTLADRTGNCKLVGVPKNITGLIEIWGDVLRGNEIDCKGYTQFNDTNFDFESHEQIIEYMRKFQDLY